MCDFDILLLTSREFEKVENLINLNSGKALILLGFGDFKERRV